MEASSNAMRRLKMPTVVRDVFTFVFGNSDTSNNNVVYRSYETGKITKRQPITKPNQQHQQNKEINITTTESVKNSNSAITLNSSNNKTKRLNQNDNASESSLPYVGNTPRKALCHYNAYSDQHAYIDPSQKAIKNEDRLNSKDSTRIATWEPTAYEKELVKRTWSDDFDFLYDLGTAIYTYIFENNPHTKKLFPAIHQHGERYKESREFRSQALKFVQTISHVVKNLYHMDQLAPFLYRIGERHVKFAERGFKPEFWNSFLDAMEVSITQHINNLKDFSSKQNADAIQVWRRLAFYIITHMKHGYFDRLNSVENGSAGLC